MRAIALIGLGVWLGVSGGCASNPTTNTRQPGKLYLTIDIPVGNAGFGILQVYFNVEGFDQQFRYKVFDYSQEANAIRQGIDIEDAYNWADILGRPVDFLQMTVEGGSEVTIQVADDAPYRGHQTLTLRIDGNAGIRSYVTQNGRFELERLY